MRNGAANFLCDLLEVLSFLSRPTLANAIHGSRYWGKPELESRDLMALSDRGYLEMERGVRSRKDRVLRLTAQGRLHALGGRDPEACWSRPWDGKWRLVLFDIPEKDKKLRDKLRRHLLSRHFGYLQNSVWISPDQFELEPRLFKGTEINAESLLTLNAEPGTGEKNSDLVRGAWDFNAINEAYAGHLEILAERPAPEEWLHSKGSFRLHRWIQAEREAWHTAVSIDPLLPRLLWPPGYLGEKSWKLRSKNLESLAKKLAAVSDSE